MVQRLDQCFGVERALRQPATRGAGEGIASAGGIDELPCGVRWNPGVPVSVEQRRALRTALDDDEARSRGEQRRARRVE